MSANSITGLKNGRIVLADSWSEIQIEKNQEKDLNIKGMLFDTETESKIELGATKQTNSFISRIIDLIKKWFNTGLSG